LLLLLRLWLLLRLLLLRLLLLRLLLLLARQHVRLNRVCKRVLVECTATNNVGKRRLLRRGCIVLGAASHPEHAASSFHAV
jgi:hypothetical protein